MKRLYLVAILTSLYLNAGANLKELAIEYVDENREPITYKCVEAPANLKKIAFALDNRLIALDSSTHLFQINLDDGQIQSIFNGGRHSVNTNWKELPKIKILSNNIIAYRLISEHKFIEQFKSYEKCWVSPKDFLIYNSQNFDENTAIRNNDLKLNHLKVDKYENFLLIPTQQKAQAFLVDLQNRQSLIPFSYQLNDNEYITKAFFSQNKRFMMTITSNSVATLWDIAQDQPQPILTRNNIVNGCFGKDDSLILSNGELLYIYTLNNLEQPPVILETHSTLKKIITNENLNFFIALTKCANNFLIYYYDNLDNPVIIVESHAFAHGFQISISRDGKFMTTTETLRESDESIKIRNELKLWQINGDEIKLIFTTTGAACCFSKDSRYLCSRVYDQKIKKNILTIWDLA